MSVSRRAACAAGFPGHREMTGSVSMATHMAFLPDEGSGIGERRGCGEAPCRSSSPTTWLCWASAQRSTPALLTPQGKILFDFFVVRERRRIICSMSRAIRRPRLRSA